jgi:hypothetical protein
MTPAARAAGQGNAPRSHHVFIIPWKRKQPGGNGHFRALHTAVMNGQVCKRGSMARPTTSRQKLIGKVAPVAACPYPGMSIVAS